MVRPPSFDMNGVKSGVWSKEEDDTLRAFVQKHGHHNWQKLPSLAGLARSGKSCRLRWVNYLQPGLKKGKFSKEEVDLIIRLHNQIGNRWSAIAEKLPGRSDNDIKNHWHAHIKKRSRLNSRAEMGHDEESFDIMNCINGGENSNVGGGVWDEAYDHRFNDSCCFSDSSVEGGGGICCSSFTTLIGEEDQLISTLGVVCHINNTPTFYDSSDRGDHMTCSSFTQLNIDIPPFYAEPEFCDLGLYHNNINHTPTFSHSSEPGMTMYDNMSTCSSFSQMNINELPQDFSVLGACESSDAAGITPSQYSTLNNRNEAVLINFNHLERAWYFGDDDDVYMNM